MKNAAIFGLIALAAILVGYYAWQSSQLKARQGMIHEQGMHVMPFDLSKTLHTFSKTDTGGIQSVTVRDAADTSDLALIRMHLPMEAEQFRAGDYSDPISLHGTDMPGVHVLEENFAKVEIAYRDIPQGGEIVFTTADPAMKAAIHAWFDAQVRDHGADAQ